MPHLTAEQILQANKLETIDIEVESFGGEIRLSDINARQKMDLLPVFRDESTSQAERMLAVLAECIVDPETNLPMFNNGNREAFKNTFKDPVLLGELFREASKLIGFDKVVDAKKK